MPKLNGTTARVVWFNSTKLFLFSIAFFFSTAAFAQPAGFTDQLYLGAWTNVVGMTFDENGRIYVFEKAGVVWIVDNGVKLSTPLIDISEEVGNWRDFGLVGFTLDPNFLTNGHIYLQYTVDRHHLMNYGTGNYNPNTNEYFSATIGRITRYTAIASNGYSTVDYNSRNVLVGETKETGIPSLHESHGIGGLVFGTDGTLIASAGDGASYSSVDQGSASETYYSQGLADGIIRADENVGAYRCQMLTSHNGKILRIDPETGDGVPSNPFYENANPRAAQSRVWAYGVRNPYRICKEPNTGSHFEGDGDPGVFYFGDVGWGNREELNIINTGGLNFGWPKFEGMTYQPGYNNPTYAPTTHERPKVDWRTGTPRALVNGTIYNVGSSQVPGPTFQGNASTGGVFYQGHDFPAAYHDTYFHADYGADWIRHFSFDANQNPTQIEDFVSNGGPIVFLASDHSYDGLFYVRYPNEIRRITYSASVNKNPIAKIIANQEYGPAPLTVQFKGDESFDPEFQNLTYLWNFGDGTTSTSINPNHTFNPGNSNPAEYTVSLTVTDDQGNTGQTTTIISVNNTPPVIVSTSVDNTNSFDPGNSVTLNLNAVVTDAEHSAGQLTWEWTSSLYHNDHFHSEPIDNNASTTTVLSPIGCDGATYWYRIHLKVTDAAGLSATYIKDIFPNCPGTNQTINFAALPNKLASDPSFSVNASASSGLPVAIFVADGPASITNGVVSLAGIPGTVTLRAIQSGNATYAPALPAEQSFEVTAGPPPNCSASGSITQETWTGIPGLEVSLIPLTTTPDASTEINIFEIPVNTDENYGVRVRGYFCAPQTGAYTFWISSDDNGELWLSSDNDPANKSLIATVPGWTNPRVWDKYPEQQSASIFLVKDKKYYIEALMKENLGGDNLAVGWQLPNGNLERPMPGSYLSPWVENPTASLVAEAAVATGVGSNWQTINLAKIYTAPVVVATVRLNNSTGAPAIARVRNATSNSFELRVQNPSGQSLTDYTVDYIVVEEGIYNVADHGIKMEAVKANSSFTAHDTDWTRENRVYQNSYNNPVVFGQVMTQNDPDWSAFWASTTTSEFDPPSSSSFAAGKHVGEDSDITRLDETLGYLVFEAGNGDLDGTPFYAALGSDIVGGVQGSSTDFLYPHSGLTNANVAILTLVGMDGDNGGWPVLYGNDPLTSTNINVRVEEDQINDAERTHTTEQFSYIVFDNGNTNPQNQSITFNALSDKLTTDAPFAISATASSGLPVSFNIISGPATISGSTVSLTGVTGTVTIQASQAGDANYNAAPNVVQSFSVTSPSQQNQTISFDAISDRLTTDPAFTITATASSGLAVMFTVVSGPASLAGNTVSLTGAEGTVTIRASQAGNSNYNPAPNVERSFNVTTGGGPVNYCNSIGNQPWQEWIEQITFGSIDNTSFKERYADFTDQQTDVTQGQNYPIVLDPGLSWPGHQTDLFWRVWIDFNQDGDFNDAGEKVVEANNFNAIVNASIAIPAAATLGLTRMRVAMKKDGYAGPCESFEKGEVEDYSVNVQDGTGGPTCNNVNSGGTISGDEVSCDAFDPGAINNVNLPSGGSGGLEYQWQYATTGSTGPWSGAGGTSSSYNPGPINQTTWYRRLARRSGCTSYDGVSNVITKTIDNCPPTGQYCDAIGNQPWVEWIDNVNFGSINNTSFKELYGDFTNLVTEAEQGVSYPLNLNPGLSWPGHQTDLFWRVWIDFNQDGDFSDAGEMVVEANNGKDPVATTVTIPATAVVGLTRMRVAVKKDSYAGPCENFTFGEVEDYSVNIVPSQNPSPFATQQILALEAQRVQLGVQLDWMTNTGYKNDHFLVERSADGIHFELLEVVENIYPGQEAFAYGFYDEHPLLGTNYYQIRQVHKDGSFRYSEKQMLHFSRHESLVVFPNPTAAEIFIRVKSFEGKAATIQIYNALGQLMEERKVASMSNTPERFQLDQYTNGIYTITVKVADRKRLSSKFVIHKL